MKWIVPALLCASEVLALVGSEAVASQEVLGFHADSESLYTRATGILREIPSLDVLRKKHPLKSESAPQQILDFLSEELSGISMAKDWFNEQNGIPDTNINHGLDLKERQRTLDGAINLLEESASLGNRDAMMMLADMHFYTYYDTPQDLQKSLTYYRQLADLGNSSAQFMVGLFHSTGVFSNFPVDQAKATLYYNFAAEGGDLRAQMALGYRYAKGVAMPQNYTRAAYWYERVARVSDQMFKDCNVPYIGTRHLMRGAWSLPNKLQGGLYGKGASRYSSGLNAALSVKSIEQAIENHLYSLEEEDTILSHHQLASLYYSGGKIMRPDFNKSVYHAQECVKFVWPASGKDRIKHVSQETKLIAGQCAWVLASRYLYGEGVLEQDMDEAARWLKRGSDAGDLHCTAELAAMMYFELGSVDGTAEEAIEMLDKVLRVDSLLSPMQARWYRALTMNDAAEDVLVRDDEGKVFYKYNHAKQILLQQASLHGVTEAVYEYALHNYRLRNFETATVNFKFLSEELDMFHSPLGWAMSRFRAGDKVAAVMGFLVGAEQGFRTAQANLAFLIDETPSIFNLKSDTLPAHSPETALVYYSRAGKQGDYDAMVKVGDSYLRGVGCDVDEERAFAAYNTVADKNDGLGIARWMVGWMYEHGKGTELDYHLAKRYYDLALESGPEAMLPVKLALLRLHAKSLWNRWTGGTAKSILTNDSKTKFFSPSFWKRFLERYAEVLAEDYGDYDFDDAIEDSHEADDLDDDDVFETALVVLIMIGICALAAWWRRRQAAQVQQGIPAAAPPVDPPAAVALPHNVQEQAQHDPEDNNGPA